MASPADAVQKPRGFSVLSMQRHIDSRVDPELRNSFEARNLMHVCKQNMFKNVHLVETSKT